MRCSIDATSLRVNTAASGLIERSADMNTRTRSGKTLLHEAGRADLIEFLLEKGLERHRLIMYTRKPGKDRLHQRLLHTPKLIRIIKKREF
jgi:uroporphyrinogen-III synthase